MYGYNKPDSRGCLLIIGVFITIVGLMAGLFELIIIIPMIYGLIYLVAMKLSKVRIQFDERKELIILERDAFLKESGTPAYETKILEYRVGVAEDSLKRIESDIRVREVWKTNTYGYRGRLKIDEEILYFEERLTKQQEELAKCQNDLKENQEKVKIRKDRMFKYGEQLEQVEKERNEWIKKVRRYVFIR